MTEIQSYDVVIVGYGPVGAVAACWLGQAGIKTLVLDKSHIIWDIPRAMALDHEILRVFQNIGVVEKVLPHTAPFGASEHFGLNGQLIRRIDVAPPPHPLGYLPNMVFSQPPVEAILRNRVQDHPSVTVHLGSEVIGIEQVEGLVRISVLDEHGGARGVFGQYVIGCDGAASTVRRLLDIPLDDLGFDEPWVVVDLLMKHAALSKLPETCAQFCDPARPYTYIIGPGNHRRWEIMLKPGEEPREMDREESIWRLLSRWIEPGDGQIWRASSYRFHALVAREWRLGNIFLAGDAAHQQPPFIGQGMCQGIRDATNLTWKLVSTLHAKSSDFLLNTYEQERKEHVIKLTTRIKEIGAAICIHDPRLAQERDEALLKQGGGEPPVVTRQEIVPPLRSGLLRDDHAEAAGTLFPQPMIETSAGNRLLDQVSGFGWRLMVDGRSTEHSLNAQLRGLTAVILGGNGLRETSGVAAAWFDAHRCRAAIVRPDHYVFTTLRNMREAEDTWNDLIAILGLHPTSPEDSDRG